MAVSSLYLTYLDLKKEVGIYLGYGLPTGDPAELTDVNKEAEVDDIVHSGYRQFLFPPLLPEQKEPYEWSFMRRLRSSSVPADEASIVLEDDFGGILKKVSLNEDGVGGEQHTFQDLTIINYDEFQTLQAVGNTAANKGLPKYVAITPDLTPETAGQKWRLYFHPVPDQSYSYTYSYITVPDKFDADAGTPEIYPLGGAQHSETLLESCLSIAELRRDDESTIHQQKFMERLAASISIDKRTSRHEDTGKAWNTIEAETTTLDQTYMDLAIQVGGFLGFGYNPRAFNHEQMNIVDSIIMRGQRNFYYPHVAGLERHEWNFLKVLGSVTTVQAFHIYDLPEDFESVIGELTYQVT